MTASFKLTPGAASTALPVLRIFSPELAVLPIAKASIGGLNEEYMKNETGAMFSIPFSFLVQTNTRGLGEVIAVA